MISQQHIENHQSGKTRWKLSFSRHFESKRSLKATKLSSVLLDTSQVFVLQGWAMKAPFKGDVLPSSTSCFGRRGGDGRWYNPPLYACHAETLQRKKYWLEVGLFSRVLSLKGCVPSSQRSDTVSCNHPSLVRSPLPHHFSLFLAQTLCSPQSSHTHTPAQNLYLAEDSLEAVWQTGADSRCSHKPGPAWVRRYFCTEG